MNQAAQNQAQNPTQNQNIHGNYVVVAPSLGECFRHATALFSNISNIQYQILKYGSNGFLGIGASPCKVKFKF